jgi:hypothetical protein
MKEELTGADYFHSVKIGSLFGFFVGLLIGVALLLYLGSKELNEWPWVASIPLWYGLGFATYGFIIGGGGVFAHVWRKEVKKTEAPGAPPIAVKPAA